MKLRTHWTISALKDYETCPLKYQYSYLFDADDWRRLGYKVVPDKGSPAMQRGTDIHESIEHYLDGTSPALHPEIGPAWAIQIHNLKDIGAVPEQQWELEEGWHPFEGGPVWLRLKMDAHYHLDSTSLALIDFKTGKPYPANMEQVEVYALAAFAMFDNVQEVHGALWYLDGDEPDEKTFKRSQASKLARKWEQRANALLKAKDYPPRRNRFCNWCAYNKAKGGPCQPP